MTAEPNGAPRKKLAVVRVGSTSRSALTVSETLKGRKLKFEPAAGAFRFVEDSVAAAQNTVLSPIGTPCEAETRRPSPLALLGNGDGQAGLAAGLDQVPIKLIADFGQRLGVQIDLVGLAGDDDRTWPGWDRKWRPARDNP